MKKLRRTHNGKGDIIKPKRPRGRPPGVRNRTTLDHSKMTAQARTGLLQMFTGSKAPAVMLSMLNGKLPPYYQELIKLGKLTKTEYAGLCSTITRNLKWAIEICLRYSIPNKIEGSISHTHTLTSLTKRATLAKKSPKILQLVEKQTQDGITQYQAEEADFENERGMGLVVGENAKGKKSVRVNSKREEENRSLAEGE